MNVSETLQRSGAAKGPRPTVALAQIAEAIFDGPFGSNLKSDDYADKGVRVVRLENIGHLRFIAEKQTYITNQKYERLKRHTLHADDVLFSSFVDEEVRVCLFPDEQGLAINKADCFCIRVDRSICDPRWLTYKLADRSTYEGLREKVHGATRPRVNVAVLKSLRIELPPLAEQRRIVTKIDGLSGKSMRAREQLNHIPRLVEKYKQSILTAAFRGDLTGAWRSARSSRTSQWRRVSLIEIAKVATGSTPKRGQRSYYDGGQIPWITSGAVNVPIIESADEYITELALKETNCKVFPAGTLVMAMYGEGQTRGRISTLGISAATNQALAAICVREDGPALTDFVLWFLRSRYLELRQQASGGVQPNLNLGIIKKQQLALPEHDEQCEIVQRIEHAFTWINRLAAEVTTARKLVDHLDKAILGKAFRGELVPEDPNDEPARILLERLRKNPATAGKKAKRKKRGAPASS